MKLTSVYREARAQGLTRLGSVCWVLVMAMSAVIEKIVGLVSKSKGDFGKFDRRP